MLTPNGDGTLDASFQVTRDGFYRVELLSPANSLVTASPKYTIDVLADQPPVVTFTKPQRDLRPTNVEEILTDIDQFDVGR